MKKCIFPCLFSFLFFTQLMAQSPVTSHPNTNEKGWVDVFTKDLSNANFEKGVWSYEDGVITATKDTAIWTDKEYNNFILDLEFKNAKGTNSGVFVHVSNPIEWVNHSVEIQIADDYDPKWANATASWQCAAIFGHQPASKKTVKQPGEWNHYTITCIDKKIWVVLNGVLVNECDLSLYTSAKVNPDGSPIPAWLSNPIADLPLKGKIGFQGKHAGAPIYFRNIKLKELP